MDDRWMDGWTDEWVVECIDGQIIEQIENGKHQRITEFSNICHGLC